MNTVDRLREVLNAEIAKPSATNDFDVRAPTVFFGAGSHLTGWSFASEIHGDGIQKRLANFIGKVGRYPMWYVPFRKDRFRYGQLARLKRRFPSLQAVDFSYTPPVIARNEQECAAAGVKLFTFTQAMDALDLAPVYETPKAVRAKTIASMDRLMSLVDRLGDERSRITLLSVLLHRVTLDRRFLDAVLCDEEFEYFSTPDHDDTLTLGESEILCDLGAAKGEVIRKFVAVTGSKYQRIHAFEPDRANFRTLEALKAGGVKNLELHNVAVGAERGTTSFVELGSYASHAGGTGAFQVDVVPLDSVVDNATFVKMDIEGAEPAAIRGAANLIGRCKPKMAVCVYHYANDVLDVADLLTSIRPDYTLKIRHHSLNLWDTILYAS